MLTAVGSTRLWSESFSVRMIASCSIWPQLICLISFYCSHVEFVGNLPFFCSVAMGTYQSFALLLWESPRLLLCCCGNLPVFCSVAMEIYQFFALLLWESTSLLLCCYVNLSVFCSVAMGIYQSFALLLCESTLFFALLLWESTSLLLCCCGNLPVFCSVAMGIYQSFALFLCFSLSRLKAITMLLLVTKTGGPLGVVRSE